MKHPDKSECEKNKKTKNRPTSVLFVCNLNAIRSPMAEALTRHLYGARIAAASAGVTPGDLDPFAVAVMAEIGIDLSGHAPGKFGDMTDGAFGVVVTLTPEAREVAHQTMSAMPVELEHWEVLDPTGVQGSREQRLEAYRQVRDDLLARVKARFGEV